MRNERAWPQQCWKSCANGSNIVVLRFGDHGTTINLAQRRIQKDRDQSK